MAESRAETLGRVMAHSPAEMQSRREAALKAKDAALAAFAVEKAAHERRIAELERQLAEEREAHIAAIRERDRRAKILRYVLAANQSSGELERRRAELRQILKDAGYYNDPKPLERLGLHLVSGRTHWKLQYANVRVTMSKTPSDYRANLNNGSEIANRSF